MMMKVIILGKDRRINTYKIKNPDKRIVNGEIKIKNNTYLIYPEEIAFHYKKGFFDKDYTQVIKSEAKIKGCYFNRDGELINDTPFITNNSAPQDNIFQILLNNKVNNEFLTSDVKEKFDPMLLMMLGIGLLIGVIIGLSLAGARL